MLLRQVLGHDDNAHLVAEPLGKVAVMTFAPLDLLTDQPTQGESASGAPPTLEICMS